MKVIAEAARKYEGYARSVDIEKFLRERSNPPSLPDVAYEWDFPFGPTLDPAEES